MSEANSGIFSAEPFSKSCSIPELYRIYHGGQEMDGQLVPRQKHIWNRVSRHLFFSANRSYVEQQYLSEELGEEVEGGEIESRTVGRNLFVADARTVPPSTLVCVNILGLWYDEVHIVEYFLSGFRTHHVKSLTDLVNCDPDFGDYQFKPYSGKHPELQTIPDFQRQLEKVKQDWFRIYTKQFNIMHMERYRKQDANVILVPGPIAVRNENG